MSERGLAYDIRRYLQKLAFDIFGAKFMSKVYYKIVMKEKLNLDNPKTFNEKIQWYKLFYCPFNSEIILCSDKYKIREYLHKKGLIKYEVPLIGAWYDVNEIPWDKLPNKFAIKCNHGCGYNIICKDKNLFDIDVAKKKLNKWIHEDFGKFNAEIHYSKIRPCVVCEEFLDCGEESLLDYKVHCFNGDPRFVLVCSDREIDKANYNYYDLDWKKLDYSNTDVKEFCKPDSLDEMIRVSKEIAKDFPFVRIDFYYVNGKLMIGELTFVPAGGLDNTIYKDVDLKMGDMLSLDI